MDFAENSRSIAVIYRIYYKVMTTTIDPRARHSLTRNETILFEANPLHSKIQVPKRLKWNELSQAGTWDLQEINKPQSIENNSRVSQILEQSNGSVQISFSPTFLPSSRLSIDKFFILFFSYSYFVY